MLTAILTGLRDSRLVWDLLGPLYNHRIHHALHELFEHIARDLSLQGNAQVLDVGAGPGHLALRVAELHPSSTVTGVDFSPMQVRAARRLQRSREIGNCRFSKANAMHLPFDEARFDAVVSVGSIKHWPDPLQGIREMVRVLRPGGLLLVSETDREAAQDDLERFMERFTAWYLWNPLLLWGLRRIVFGQSFSEGQLMKLLERSGSREVQAHRLEGCPYVIVKARRG
ncbi:MAG TPA: class I SAM-dependent methyltransferase [Deltaproteobacteria bacterium]|nr:class I SAM-dependent methyltransferase [Deltaproteobacteria bacterium]HQI81689.1 class I SAM-dependent methyltransferase [Deltaproteobacteria bacterium]